MRRRAKNQPKQQNQPSTAEEFLEAAVDEEDHGDRWTNSGDIPKGARFYSRAIDLYNTAISKDTPASWISDDCIYNITRLKYVVYSKAIKTGELLGKPEYDDPKWPHSLAQVVEGYELALRNVLPEKRPIDMLYNYAQILTELGEESSEVAPFLEAERAFETVLRSLFEKAAIGQAAPDANMVIDDSIAELEEEEGEGVARAKDYPQDIVETMVSYLQCITSLSELLRSDNVAFMEYGQKMDMIASELVRIVDPAMSTSGPVLLMCPSNLIGLNPVSLDVASLSEEIRTETAVALARHRTVFASSLEDLEKIWTSPGLPDTVDKCLVQAETYLDVHDMSSDQQVLWNAYKRASDVLAAKSADKELTPLQKRKLYLMRGDIEWMRSQLDWEPAIRNKNLLLKNANALYQNCINVQTLAPDAEMKFLAREATVKRLVLEERSREEIIRLVGEGAQVILPGMVAQGLLPPIE